MKKRLVMLLICAAMLLCGAAMAEEEILSAHVELFAEGAVPEETPVLTSMFGANAFDEYMIENLNAQAERIELLEYGLTPDEFYNAYQRLLNAHPELFFVYGGYRYVASDGYVKAVLPTYNYTGDELTELQAVYNSGLAAAVKYARKSDTDLGRMLRANDYFCANFCYDTSYTIYSPELLFRDNTGVCQAYMLAYRAVLNELGITNITVSSKEINHTWNMVYLDGEWYHIDVTWNDPVTDIPLRACHSNFLLSDEGITATGHYGWDDSWEVVVAAESTKFDSYFWSGIRNALAMNGDVIYYVDTDYSSTLRDVYAYDIGSGTKSKVYTYDYGNESYYVGIHPLWYAFDTLYYAVRDTLYAVNLSDGQAVAADTLESSDQQIWYLYSEGNDLLMYVGETPNSGGQVCSGNLARELIALKDWVEPECGDVLTAKDLFWLNQLDADHLEWTSSDESVAAMDGSGNVTAVGPGAALITVRYAAEDLSAQCLVAVHWNDALSLPQELSEIGAEAFDGVQAAEIRIFEAVSSIGSRAFAGNSALKMVYIPESVALIEADAFDGCGDFFILCHADSEAERFAQAQEIPYTLIP